MSKHEEKGLVPALRFPEFRNAGEWKKKPLALYIEQFSERVSSSTELEVYSSTREGLKPQSEYFDGRKLANDGEYGVVPTGYFVYRHMSDDDVFKFNLNQLGKKIAVSKEYPVFKTVNLDARFLQNKLNEGQEFKKFAIIQKKGGTRTRLYFKTLLTFKPYLPVLEEQQKIADCLTSVDELITVQTQKLDALKTHKKSLMQQLFPAEGETVPQLRFPEFRNRGEWKEKELSQVCEVNPSANGLPEQFVYIDLESVEAGQLLQKRIISREGAPSRAQRVLKKGDVVFQMVRPYQKNNYFFFPNDDLDYVASTGYAQLRAHESNRYLFQYLHNDRFVDRVLAKCTGSNYPAINSSELSEILVESPEPDEQQKIADCLTSIDDLITAQAKKVESLKAHKKGLMQQIFPVMDEVDA